MSDELKKSLNTIQASTGKSDEAMKGMRETMLSIYNNNYGTDFEDIGAAIAEVGKQTGATAKELQTLTESAFALRDTFEFDVTESTRSAQMMIKQFGLTGDQAFNLITQGAQKGLDKNGDLLDSINEYSVHFKQAGFSAAEMFNMLDNGTKSGTFSVDKLGDAVKEFGIRSKDGSKGTGEAFKALGLDAEKLTQNFAQGGKVGKQAFEEVNKKLLAIKDPVKQNALGVALYGTAWEDLGVKGVAALTDTKGSIDKTKQALDELKNVKYATFGEAMEGIKRNITTGILIPIGDLALPLLNDFSTWITANMPAIKKFIADAFVTIKAEIDKFIVVITWVKNNLPLVMGVLKLLTGSFIAYKVAVIAANIVMAAHKIAQLSNILLNGTEATTTGMATVALLAHNVAAKAGALATGAFNLVMSMNPIAAVILALLALGLGILAIVKHWDDITAAISKAWNWLKKWNKEPAENKNATVNTRYTRSGSTSQYGGVSQFAIGSRYIPYDMQATIHRGEMIVPKSENPYANSKGNILGSKNVNHTGTITVKGVNDKNQLLGVVDVIMEQLRKEVRTS